MRKAKRILELGTSYGYSTMFLAAAHATGGKIHTLELAPTEQKFAQSQLHEAGLGACVEWHVGDATSLLEDIPRPFDFVLVDLWKDLYVPCFELFYPKLADTPRALNEMRQGWRIIVAALLGIDTRSDCAIRGLDSRQGRGAQGGTGFQCRIVSRLPVSPPRCRQFPGVSVIGCPHDLSRRGAAPVSFTRLINMRFNRARGTALGLAQMATGLAAALIPPLLIPYIAQHGWRAGYIALAISALSSMPTIILLIGRENSMPSGTLPSMGKPIDLAFSQAVRTTVFVNLGTVFGLGPSVGGSNPSAGKP